MMFKQQTKGKNEISMIFSPPEVHISPLAYAKMLNIVKQVDDEVGWLGTATRSKNRCTILIDDVFLFEQDVNGSTCEITPEGLGEFASKLIEKENGIEIWNSIKVWGHSHVNMGTTPSGQDDSQMETFANGNEWFIRIIANKKGELTVDYYDYQSNYMVEDLNWKIYIEELYETREFIEKEVKEKVRKKKYKKPKTVVSWKAKKEKEEDNIISLEDKAYQDELAYYNNYYAHNNDEWHQGYITMDYYSETEILAIGSCRTIEEAEEEIIRLITADVEDKDVIEWIWQDCVQLLDEVEEWEEV